MIAVLSVVLVALLGAFTWSVAEYMLHAWVFHKVKNFVSREHRLHHTINGYFAPTWLKIINAFVVLGAVGTGLSFVVGPTLGVAYAAGFALGYLAYELFHRRLHTHAPRNGFGRWARRHHFYHHLVDARENHGVTSPIWDHVFGTHKDPGVVTVHAKMAPVWLWDVEKDDVRAEYAADYVKKVKRSAARSANDDGRGLALDRETAAAAP